MGRAQAMATQQRWDGRRRHSHPELGEFSLDPQASHLGFSRPIRRMRSRTSGAIGGRPPVDAWWSVHFLRTSPAKERLWLDQERGPSLSRERSAQRSQVQPVPAAEAGPADLAPEDCELVAKHEDLDVVVPSIGRASHEGDQPGGGAGR